MTVARRICKGRCPAPFLACRTHVECVSAAQSLPLPCVSVPWPHVYPYVRLSVFTSPRFWPLCSGLNVVVVEMQSVDIFEVLALREGENTDNEGDGDDDEEEEVEEAEGAQ